MADDGAGAHSAVARVHHVTMAVAALGRMMAKELSPMANAGTRIISA